MMNQMFLYAVVAITHASLYKINFMVKFTLNKTGNRKMDASGKNGLVFSYVKNFKLTTILLVYT